MVLHVMGQGEMWNSVLLSVMRIIKNTLHEFLIIQLRHKELVHTKSRGTSSWYINSRQQFLNGSAAVKHCMG